MDLRLKNLRALVTGGTSGIGLAIVERLAQEGCNIVTCSRSSERNAQLVQKLSSSGISIVADTVDITSADAAGWVKSLGSFDIFIPNVSALSPDWQDSVSTDIFSTVALTESAISTMNRSKIAAITYVGSKAATFATPGFEAYGATKAAMVHYMKSLSQRTQGAIRVNVVSPGDTFFEGGFWDKIRVESPDIYESTKNNNPLKRFCTPEEVANAVVFLSSPTASFINGAHLLVDGGATMHVHG